jgi:predicted dehydrogenase
MIRLMTLSPGHFHAALVQKRGLYGVHPRSYVYGPLDNDTLAHVARIASFNARRDDPTAWEVDLRAGADYLQRFVREQPGNTVILSGRNRPKIDLMQLAVENCLHVVADKPWIVEHADFPKLEALFREADLRDVLVWDMLTERFEITNWLQREFIRDPEVFGQWQTGTPEQPALYFHSVHHLKKSVNGQPLVRPWWWFDPDISGESMADVGTHLADLAIWFVAPEQAVDYTRHVTMLTANRESLWLTEDQFRQVTRLPAVPSELKIHVTNGQLRYASSNTATFTLKGIHTRLSTAWEFESPGGDTHQCYARGSRATISVRQQPSGRTELYISAADPGDHPKLLRQLREKCNTLQREFSGMSVADLGHEAQVLIPESWRAGHEEHFASVMDEFMRYFQTPRAVPSWEKPNALARYYITTKAVQMARASST